MEDCSVQIVKKKWIENISSSILLYFPSSRVLVVATGITVSLFETSSWKQVACVRVLENYFDSVTAMSVWNGNSFLCGGSNGVINHISFDLNNQGEKMSIRILENFESETPIYAILKIDEGRFSTTSTPSDTHYYDRRNYIVLCSYSDDGKILGNVPGYSCSKGTVFIKSKLHRDSFYGNIKSLQYLKTNYRRPCRINYESVILEVSNQYHPKTEVLISNDIQTMAIMVRGGKEEILICANQICQIFFMDTMTGKTIKEVEGCDQSFEKFYFRRFGTTVMATSLRPIGSNYLIIGDSAGRLQVLDNIALFETLETKIVGYELMEDGPPVGSIECIVPLVPGFEREKYNSNNISRYMEFVICGENFGGVQIIEIDGLIMKDTIDEMKKKDKFQRTSFLLEYFFSEELDELEDGARILKIIFSNNLCVKIFKVLIT